MPPGAHHKAKTHCPKGHPYDEANTRIRPDGSRACRQCGREKSLLHYHSLSPDEKYETGRRRALARYGLTESEYFGMIDRQKGLCAICQQRPDGMAGICGILHVDHGPDGVRAMLCSRCNQGLGLFLHNPQLLRAAADYLDR